MKKKAILFFPATKPIVIPTHTFGSVYLIRRNTGNCTNHRPGSTDNQVLNEPRTTCHEPHSVLPSEAFSRMLEEVELRL